MADAKDLITKLKSKKIILLNAAEWNVVFKAYREDEALCKEALEIIYHYVYAMIEWVIKTKELDERFVDDYRNKVIERVQKQVLNNQEWVNVSYLRSIVLKWAAPEALKSPGIKPNQNSTSTIVDEDGKEKDIIDTLPDPKLEIMTAMICKEQQEYFLKYVDEMKGKDRFVIECIFFKEMIQAEVAKLLNVGRTAVAERLRGIKKRLRAKLAEIDADKTVPYAISEGV